MTVNDVLQELEGLKKSIESTKRDIANKEGQAQQIWSTLKQQKITTETQLDARIEELAKKRKDFEKQIPAMYEELHERYEW